ncbi:MULTISPECIES: hypothetical protein [Acinetobacter]|uniref:Lipoprotein n=1 Tax=Acinetobacter nematophilus TaxID=2994642 RepID=A0A9X3IJ54_9GAMM|nr:MULTISPECIES: hypothetical protein [Acinetobacter]MBJ9953222.1 hypothetical protein [Acinetobacter baumannii]MCX5469911.1 hypothetical protein [Acinetobacter nematophilus]
MSISKQILIFISIIGAFLLLSCYDRFITQQTGKEIKQSTFIESQD